MNRRTFVQLALAATASLSCLRFGLAKAIAATVEKLSLTDAQWKAKLAPEAYDVLRHEATERPFSSSLLHETREGIFACAGCNLDLFPSTFKFDSGTGWPSFFDAIPGHIETKTDYAIVLPRTEYHCARCGGHHGHVFDDGPKPTGLRYCSNGAALTFIPKIG